MGAEAKVRTHPLPPLKRGIFSFNSQHKINNKLRHNRQVLQRASPEGKTTLRREVLQLAGFDFRHFTHLYRTKNGNTTHFCYDYGYLLLEDKKVLILNWQLYIDKLGAP